MSKLDFTELPMNIGDLYNLQVLNVSKNDLSCLPLSINRLTNLQRIHFNDNRIEDISLLEGLPVLKEIYGKNNCLTKFISPSKYPSLTNINLSGNQLTTLPHNIHVLRKLESLRLTDNQIQFSFSEVDMRLDLQNLHLPQNLIQINLSNNNITMLPKTLFHISHLEEIYVYNNPLHSDNLDQYKIRSNNATYYGIENP